MKFTSLHARLTSPVDPSIVITLVPRVLISILALAACECKTSRPHSTEFRSRLEHLGDLLPTGSWNHQPLGGRQVMRLHPMIVFMSAHTPDPSSPPVGQNFAPATRLSAFSRSWRVALAASGLIILAAAQVVSTNDWFPLGSLSQYSYARPLDSPTKSVRIRAMTEAGKERGAPLSNAGVGIGRAEIEGQLARIIANPNMLEGIARGWSGLHPDEPQFVHLRMERVIRTVKNGVPTGEETVEVLTEWTVMGTYGNYTPKEPK